MCGCQSTRRARGVPHGRAGVPVPWSPDRKYLAMSTWPTIGLDAASLATVVARALAEDVGPGDVTTLATIPAAAMCEARLNTRAAGVVCGLPVAMEAFRQLDPSVDVTTHHHDS